MSRQRLDVFGLRHLRQGTRSPEIAERVERRVYDSLPFWAALSEQTPEWVRAAIEQVEEAQRKVPSSSEALKSDYVFVERIIAGELDPVEVIDFSRRPRDWEIIAVRWLPWEEARARRVLDLITARSLEMLQDVESAVRRNQKCPLPDRPYDHPYYDDGEWSTLKRTTALFDAIYRPRGCYFQGQPRRHYSLYHHPQGYFLACDFARMETRRRAVRLQLALAAWRKEHGQLPERLQELVGPLFAELPLDPYSGAPFEYFPNGTSAPILNLVPLPGDVVGDTLVKAGKPYFQSAGVKRRSKCGSDRDFIFEIPVDP